MSKTRADYPVGTEVEYAESGQLAVVVSESEQDEEYESATDLFVRMNGQILRTDVSRLK